VTGEPLFQAGQDQIARQVNTARRVLRQLSFDPERSNDRSALVLLALLRLTPDMSWAGASNPMMRTVEIMDWVRSHYAKDYKPNTRETIRQTASGSGSSSWPAAPRSHGQTGLLPGGLTRWRFWAREAPGQRLARRYRRP